MTIKIIINCDGKDCGKELIGSDNTNNIYTAIKKYFKDNEPIYTHEVYIRLCNDCFNKFQSLLNKEVLE